MTKLEQLKNEIIKSRKEAFNDIDDIKFTDVEKNNLIKQYLQQYKDFEAFMKSEIENKHDFNKILYEAAACLKDYYAKSDERKAKAAFNIMLFADDPEFSEGTVYDEIYQYTLKEVADSLASNYTYNEKFNEDPLDFETIAYRCMAILEIRTFPKYFLRKEI